MSEPTLPLWFKQRQARLEPAGENTYKVAAPNAAEAFIGIRPSENGHYAAFLKAAADGEDVVSTAPKFPNAFEPWEAAFELYRQHVIY